MDVNGVIDPKPNAADKKTVAKVCLDPSTLEVNSAAVVRLSAAEIRKIETDFQIRTYRMSRQNEPLILSDQLIKALERAAKGASSAKPPSNPSDKKK